MYTNNEKYWKHIKKIKNNAKLCFIHIPKCGGTFVNTICSDLNIRRKGHLQANINDGITFAILRNPVERFESLINYRVGESKPRDDWPKHLNYVFDDKSITLDTIVNSMSNNDLLSFRSYRTLIYWSENIDVFITIDNLHNFLSFFGYNYDINKYNIKQNVSKKERGKFSELTKSRIANVFSKDMLLFKRTVN